MVNDGSMLIPADHGVRSCWSRFRLRRVVTSVVASLVFAGSVAADDGADVTAESTPANVEIPTADGVDAPTNVPIAPDQEPVKQEEKYPVDKDEWLDADPLLIIDTEMNSVVTDLRAGTLKRPHESTQPRIVARFDRLIEILERKKGGVGSGSPNSSMPAEQSGIRNGSAESGELTAKNDETGAMSRLPPSQRAKIQQASQDGFPPGFEDVLSDYFRRLAETKAAE